MDETVLGKLRTPQQEALDLISEYLKNAEEKSCLIHMPTGSGKSGIISVLSNIIFSDCILIVTPRVALTEQLYDDVRNDFFSNVIRETPNPYGKYFQLLKSDFVLDDKKNYSDSVFTTTIQKIDWLRTNNERIYKQLINKVKLIIFDEGHYEPAYSWNVTMRNFTCKKILFTATPFRNDLKVFDISEEYIYPYSYSNGVRDKYLRTVKFIRCEEKKNDKAFIENILANYRKIFGEFNKKSPKIIIRCSSRKTVRRLANYLLKNYPKIPTIAIHERFNNKIDGDPFYKKVPPDVKINPAKIWLHQNKLLEGIDDNQFRMLAIYDKFKNDRALIQQIGRLVRRSSTKKEDAYVLDHSGGYHTKVWNNYLEFDSELNINSFKPLTEKVLDKLYEIGNNYEYIFNGFKEKFDFNQMSIPDELQLPLKVNLLKKTKNFKIETINKFTKSRLEKQDKRIIYKEISINGNKTHTFFTLSLGYCPFFKNHYSLNISNDLVLYFEKGNVLCYYDSTGYVPLNEEELGLSKAYDIKYLKKIFNENNNVVINAVSLQNSNIGTNSIRSHAYSAKSIDNTVSYLDDNAHIVSTVNGKYRQLEKVNIETEKGTIETNTIRLISRYVGMGKGRVSQRSEWCNLNDYIEWVNEILKLTKKQNIKPKKTFERYSQVAEQIKDNTPKHILVDLTEILDDFTFIENANSGNTVIHRGQLLDYLDVCSEIYQEKKDNKLINYFFLSFTEEISLKVIITFNNKRNTYKLDSDKLDEMFEPNRDSPYESILEYLNKNQSFKIIPGEPDVIFAYGQFYKIYETFGEKFNPKNYFLNDSIIPIIELANISSEKGMNSTRNNGESWESNSIFGLIDDLGYNTKLARYISDPSIMVYDDMCTEVADVILVYENSDATNQKVIFIHAKWSDNKKYSASSLQIVCSQATKNIRLLNNFNNTPPPNLNLWDKPWKSDGLVVNRRIRKPTKINSVKCWERIHKVIKNPLSQKEVWLVVGQTLSKKRLFEELQKSTYEAIQATLLLHSTMQNVGTVNAKFRMFCSP